MNIQQYLLGVLAEECAEVAIRCSKAIRFGVDEVQPGQEIDNCGRIYYELNDLYAVLEMLSDNGVSMIGVNRKMVDAKKAKVIKFMELSRERGILEKL